MAFKIIEETLWEIGNVRNQILKHAIFEREVLVALAPHTGLAIGSLRWRDDCLLLDWF